MLPKSGNSLRFPSSKAKEPNLVNQIFPSISVSLSSLSFDFNKITFSPSPCLSEILNNTLVIQYTRRDVALPGNYSSVVQIPCHIFLFTFFINFFTNGYILVMGTHSEYKSVSSTNEDLTLGLFWFVLLVFIFSFRSSVSDVHILDSILNFSCFSFYWSCVQVCHECYSLHNESLYFM